MLYRVPLTWGGDKLPWKLAHAVLMLLALLLSVVGLCAVFQDHTAKRIPPLYSLHSWVGVCSVALFAGQVGPPRVGEVWGKLNLSPKYLMYKLIVCCTFLHFCLFTIVFVHGEWVNLVMVSVYREWVNSLMVSVYGEWVKLVMVSVYGERVT